MKERTEYSRIIQRVTDWHQLEKGGIIRLFHSCVESGITSFDIGSPDEIRQEESSLGTALSESGLSRDEIQLIARIEDATQESLEKEVDDLLLELGTDYLDLLLIGEATHVVNLLGVLEKMFSQGKLYELGITGLPPGPFEKSDIPVQVFQTSLTLLSTKVLKSLEEQGPTAEKWKVFTYWSLEQSAPHSMQKALADLKEKYQLSHEELLMVWLFQHPANFHFVVEGATEVEIDRFGELKEVSLHPFDWQKIKLILTD